MEEKQKNENLEESTPLPYIRTTKIGNTTFVVSTRFSSGRQRDIVSTFARLVQHDMERQNPPSDFS